MYLCRYAVLNTPDFPAFSIDKLAANGGVLEECDEQAVLAASVSTGNVVSGLLNRLIQGEPFLTIQNGQALTFQL